MTPRCSFDDSREERIPPSAPASETSGAMIASRAGYVSKCLSWGSTAVPASISSRGVSRITPTISRMARRARGRSVNAPRSVTNRHTAMHRPATVAFSTWLRTRNVARYRVGIVTMSALEVTTGVDTVSRS